MDAQFQVSSDDFEANSAKRNSSYSEESDRMLQIVQKEKNYQGKVKSKQQKPTIKKVIKKRDLVKKNNQQISDKNITSNNQQMIQKQQFNFSNNFDGYIADVFGNDDENLQTNNKEKVQINQNIIQENLEHKIQVQNQFNQIELEKDKDNIIQEQKVEKIQANEIQQNQLPNYLNNAGQFQYLRSALSKVNKNQPIFFKRFLNYLQMTEEEYDNIKQSFPEIPPEYLPQVILEQRQINKVFQNNQPQQQQQQQQSNNQFLWNQQQYQYQHQHQHEIQQQKQQLNFIETVFKFNPNLSECNLECVICAQTYLDGDKLAILPCIHRFHLTCFTSWLKKKSTQCPICYHG